MNRFMVLSAFFLAAIHAAAAQAPGGLALPARVIPAPSTVSPQLQKSMPTAPSEVLSNVPRTAAEWKAQTGARDTATAEQLPAFAQKYKVKIEPRTIAGVKCYIVTPDSIPAKNQDRLLVHVHGGAYVGGGGPASAYEAVLMASAAGIKSIAVDYRMPPDFPYPAAMDDAMAVWAEAVKMAAPANIGIFGTSTGGGMTLLIVQRALAEKRPLPGAIASGTPWSDLSKTGDSYATNEDIDAVLPRYDGFLGAAAVLYANGLDLKDPRLSPVYGSFKGFPPTILVTGTRDLFLSNTVRVHRKLREAGAIADLQVFEGISHGTYLLYPDFPESAQAFSEMAKFFDAHLGGRREARALDGTYAAILLDGTDFWSRHHGTPKKHNTFIQGETRAMNHPHLSSAQVRKQLKHPVIDADGHFVEIGPLFDDALIAHLESVGGASLREKYLASGSRPFNTANVLAGREDPVTRREWKAAPSWWGWQTKNTYDRATSHLPKLTYERMDEMGIDFMLAYPSTALGLIHTGGELGAALARGANKYLASLFAPYKDRIAVGAIIPMDTPQLAIAELEYAVKELGAKTAVIAGYARRNLGDKPANGPQAIRTDHFGIDSDYDYDPFWAKCIELGISPVTHSSHMHLRVSRSVSNYVYNHIGCLATSHESLCKSLLMSGVTRRFPKLRVGFLEGGVSWACQLYSDLIGHWSKRNADAIVELDPDRLDVPKLMDYIKKYGDETMIKHLGRLKEFFAAPAARPKEVDDFSRALIKQAQDIRDLFVPHFYFGCEADDPMMAWAFADKVNPMGAKLRAMFGSDIAHWDVVDMAEPVEEAYEMVTHGTISEDNFRDFMFLNPLRLHASSNPNIFKGTVIEKAAAEAIAKGLN